MLHHASMLLILTEVKGQATKAWWPIIRRLLPIVIDDNFSHPAKALSLMIVTLLGKITEVKSRQSAKAELSMVVTLLGIVTEVKNQLP